MRWRAAIIFAVCLYLLLGSMLIAQRPGLYDDEAMMTAGAVHVLSSSGDFRLPHADRTWICKFQHCLPLMAEGRYIGAVKDYLCLPLFAMFGPRVAIIRWVSLLLGAIGIGGIALLVYRQASPAIAAVVAFALALNPSYATALIFDNGAVAATMGALGMVCAALALYAARPTAASAFWIGVAAGFGIWARANFIWLLAAGVAGHALAGGLNFKRQAKACPTAFAGSLGAVIGGLPFLLYQVLSRGGTWQALGMFTTAQPIAQLVRYRLFLFADTLLADGEHRRMWGGLAAMPGWQLWLWAVIAAAACVVCLWLGRSLFARSAALAFALLTSYMLFTRLEVAEHHMIAAVPLAVLVSVLACVALQERFRQAWVFSAILAVTYAGSAIYWQATAIRALRGSGGVGLWSNAVFDLARYLDRQYPGREIKILDWGFENNVFVLTRGRLRSKDLFWGDRRPLRSAQEWTQEIREGGIFVAGGPQAVETPAGSPEFLSALAEARPIFTRHTIAQKNGMVFADVLDIEPNTIRGPASQELTGVYPLESAGWRWTKAQFSVRLEPDLAAGGLWLVMHVFVPEPNIEKLGSIALSASIGEHALPPETFRAPGPYTLERELNPEWLKESSGWVKFSLDKWLAPGSADTRELGIVLQDVSVEQR